MCTIHLRAVESQRSIGELVAEQPNRAIVLERFGIDYCCGGNRTLVEACCERGIDPNEVLVEFEHEPDRRKSLEPASASLTITELTAHIVTVHHAGLREELPRIERLIQKCVAAHGARNPRFLVLSTEFRTFADELEIHMMKEERVLFPLAEGYERGIVPSPLHCGGIEFPIAVMESEHRDVAETLARFHRLTDDYTAPPEACATWRELLRSLRAMERDLHFHIHEENNLLHPRALAVAREFTRRDRN